MTGTRFDRRMIRLAAIMLSPRAGTCRPAAWKALDRPKQR
jgi:hypothetical protein